jgi:hypothetical protein
VNFNTTVTAQTPLFNRMAAESALVTIGPTIRVNIGIRTPEGGVAVVTLNNGQQINYNFAGFGTTVLGEAFSVPIPLPTNVRTLPVQIQWECVLDTGAAGPFPANSGNAQVSTLGMSLTFTASGGSGPERLTSQLPDTTSGAHAPVLDPPPGDYGIMVATLDFGLPKKTKP